MPATKTTDLVIIGGGPAGLAAALTFARIKRPAIVYDSGLYRNAKTNSSHTIPGFDGQDPMVYKAKVRADIEKSYGWIEFRDEKVTTVRRTGKGFEVESPSGKVSARKVVIATGIQDNLPAIPGKSPLFGMYGMVSAYCRSSRNLGETSDPLCLLRWD